MKLGLISLGCCKNLVDSELFLGLAKKYNLDITSSMEDADIIVINTCGFIESAKQEAIDTILEAIDYKDRGAKIVVIGCLVERYLNDLKESLPEVDYFVPIREYPHLDSLFKTLTNSDKSYCLDYQNRLITTSESSAYLRIADGCDNKCSYCAIPLIRGGFISRNPDDIIAEAKTLANQGIKEITLIAQDTTRYGTDFKDKDPRRLEYLLHEISKIDEVKWIRVLYLYPDEITEAVLTEMKNNDKVLKYFDIPIQHASNKILKSMNRRGSQELIYEHINYIREYIPEAIIRTTLMTGFPGETDEDFEEMLKIVKDAKFERLGCFTFSLEEGTKAEELTDFVDSDVAEKRYDQIMELQTKISEDFNKSLIGKTYECIIEGYDYDKLAYYGRNYMYAPDDVDGKIYIYSAKELEIGSFVTVEIIDSDTYDLEAKAI